MTSVSFKHVIENLATYRYESWDHPTRRPEAAVLVPLFVDKLQRAKVFLTVRSTKLKRHSGEVAFPGGKCEPGETEIQTALREAQEEIGVDSQHVRIVTVLEPFLTKFKQVVRPVIGVIDDSFQPKLNSREVATVFSVPLEIFLGKSCHHYVDWAFERHPWRLHHFTYNGHMIWGLSALMLIHIAKIGYQKNTEFEVDLPGSPTHFQVMKALTRDKSCL